MKYQPHPTNLKSGNFKGKDFTGADFSHADIRGADFSNAVLIGTNFCNSKAGLPHFWVISLTGLSIIMAFLAGIVSGYAAALIGDLLSNHSYGFYFFGLFSLITLVLFFSVIFWRGLGVMLVTIADVLVACLIVAVAFLPNKEPGLFLTVDAQFTAIALAGAMVSVINMAVAVALAKVLVIPLATTSTGLTSFIGIILGVSLGVRSNELIYIQAVLNCFDSNEPDKPGIKEMLTDLQAAIEADTSLSEEDKAEALEQVKKIAEAGQKPEDGSMQKIAKNALTFLKGLVVDLPSTAEIVKTCGNLIPIIKQFFGLP